MLVNVIVSQDSQVSQYLLSGVVICNYSVLPTGCVFNWLILIIDFIVWSIIYM